MKKLSHKELNIIGEKFLKSSVNYNYKSQITRVELKSSSFETPDVIGLSSGRSIIIESKTSRQDFLKDKNKWHRKSDGIGDYRFFLCEENVILEKDLYDDWGLLYTNGTNTWIVKHPNYRGKRDLTQECLIMYSIIRRLEKKNKI